MIICKVEPEQFWDMKAIFVRFQFISGLKINLGKSELVPVGNVQFWQVF